MGPVVTGGEPLVGECVPARDVAHPSNSRSRTGLTKRNMLFLEEDLLSKEHLSLTG